MNPTSVRWEHRVQREERACRCSSESASVYSAKKSNFLLAQKERRVARDFPSVVVKGMVFLEPDKRAALHKMASGRSSSLERSQKAWRYNHHNSFEMVASMYGSLPEYICKSGYQYSAAWRAAAGAT